MFGILVFLFLLSLLLTHFNYRLSLFMFPDGVYINKFQGFLGWYGFTNLFVSIPFLWDGDFKQGVFPFVLGVVPLIIAIISVFRLNTNVNVQYRRGLKVLSNADAIMVEPGNDVYGFLDGSIKRMREIGPKFYFKELFARERENRVLADTLLEEGAEATLNAITVLPWVQDKAVTVKSQIIFLFHYMIARYDRQKLISNFDSLSKSVLELCSRADLSFAELPYPIAVFIAQTNALVATVGKDELRFTMDLDGYVCDDDENVIAQFAGYSYIASDAPGLLSRIIHDYALRFTGKRCYLTLTNKHMIYRIDGEQDKIVDLSLSREYKRVFNSITFDNKRFFKFYRSSFFKFVVDILNG